MLLFFCPHSDKFFVNDFIEYEILFPTQRKLIKFHKAYLAAQLIFIEVFIFNIC